MVIRSSNLMLSHSSLPRFGGIYSTNTPPWWLPGDNPSSMTRLEFKDVKTIMSNPNSSSQDKSTIRIEILPYFHFPSNPFYPLNFTEECFLPVLNLLTSLNCFGNLRRNKFTSWAESK